jgi:MFS family permease
VGLPGIGVAIILHWTVKDPKRGSFDPKPVVAQAEPAASIREVFRTLWRRPSFRALMVGGGIASFAGTGFGFWLPVLFERVHDMSRMEVGLIFGPVMAVSGSAGAIMAGLITDRLGKRDQRFLMWIPAASVFLSLPFLLGVCLWPTSFGAIVFAIPSGILGGGWAPAIYAAAQNLAPPRMRALAASLMILSITLVGMGAGPQVVGILNDVLASRFGDDAVRYSMAIVLATSVVGSLVLLLGARHLREDLRAGSVSS